MKTHMKVTRAVRVMIFLAALVAGITMISSSQNIKYKNGLTIEPKFSKFGSFMFFAIANFIFCMYSLGVACLPEGTGPLWTVVLILDVFVGMVICGSMAAAWTYYNLLNTGNGVTIYAALCATTRNFCSGVFRACIAGTIAFSIHSILLFFSFLMVLF